ncbi:MAG TPA: helix-turn-helix transcriptional regulator [Acidimicrobiia bacterium]
MQRTAANGAAIRAIRVRSQRSLRSVAEDAGVSFSHLAGIERGESSPTLRVLEAIAEALDVPVSAITRDQIEVAS